MTRRENSPFVERVLAWSLDHPLSPASRYMVAAIVVMLVGIVRATFITALLPWLLFIPTIIGIVLLLGEGPGVLASLLAVLLAGATIGSRAEPWFLTGPQWTASLLFLIIALGLTRLTGELRAAFRRIDALATQLGEREAFLSGVLASSTDCIKVLDLDGRIAFVSDGGLKVMEATTPGQLVGRHWSEIWGESRAAALAAIDRGRVGTATQFMARAPTLAGVEKWWDVSVSPILGSDGTADRILVVSRDSSALMQAQEQQRLLTGELGHRLKNVLALVQSIASQTIRRAANLDEANSAFAARLSALGKASDILTATAWQSATLGDVARAGLTCVDGLAERVDVAGPAVALSSQLALALTLALHELATNACKYGALSNEDGTVTLRWDVFPDAAGGEDRFTLTWREAGGPIVQPPTHRGFGTRMIERSLQAYFQGEMVLDYDPAGLCFRIDAPFPKDGGEPVTAG